MIWKQVERYIDRASDGGKVLAIVALFMMTAAITINTLLRKFANAPIFHLDELLTYMTAGIVFLGMGYCARVNGHIRVEVLLSRLNRDLRRKVQATGMVMSMVWIGGLTYGMWRLWLLAFTSGETSFGTLRMLMWIPGIIYLVGITLFFLQVILEIVRSYKGKLGIGQHYE